MSKQMMVLFTEGIVDILLHIVNTQAMNMTIESTPAPTPNVNQQDQTAAKDVCSSNTPIRTSGRIVKKRERYIEIC